MPESTLYICIHRTSYPHQPAIGNFSGIPNLTPDSFAETKLSVSPNREQNFCIPRENVNKLLTEKKHKFNRTF